MDATAKLNNCPSSPRKMRLVIDMIRGIEVNKALGLLKYNGKHASRNIDKLLLSAISNWEKLYEKSADSEQLFITEVFVNQGRTIKRFRPAPQGRAHRIRKRSNHVVLTVGTKAGKPVVAETEQQEN